MKRVLIPIALASVLGFFLVYPLGWLFDAMGWPIFNSWALLHGMAPGAWVLLSGASYVGLRLVFGRRREGRMPPSA